MSLCAGCEPVEFRLAAVRAVKEVIGASHAGVPGVAAYCVLCDLLGAVARSPERALGVHAIARTAVDGISGSATTATLCWLQGPHTCAAGAECSIVSHVDFCGRACDAAIVSRRISSLLHDVASSTCRLVLSDLGPTATVDQLRSLFEPRAPTVLTPWMWQCVLAMVNERTDGWDPPTGATAALAFVPWLASLEGSKAMVDSVLQRVSSGGSNTSLSPAQLAVIAHAVHSQPLEGIASYSSAQLLRVYTLTVAAVWKGQPKPWQSYLLRVGVKLCSSFPSLRRISGDPDEERDPKRHRRGEVLGSSDASSTTSSRAHTQTTTSPGGEVDAATLYDRMLEGVAQLRTGCFVCCCDGLIAGDEMEALLQLCMVMDCPREDAVSWLQLDENAALLPNALLACVGALLSPVAAILSLSIACGEDAEMCSPLRLSLATSLVRACVWILAESGGVEESARVLSSVINSMSQCLDHYKEHHAAFLSVGVEDARDFGTVHANSTAVVSVPAVVAMLLPKPKCSSAACTCVSLPVSDGVGSIVSAFPPPSSSPAECVKPLTRTGGLVSVRDAMLDVVLTVRPAVHSLSSSHPTVVSQYTSIVASMRAFLCASRHCSCPLSAVLPDVAPWLSLAQPAVDSVLAVGVGTIHDLQLLWDCAMVSHNPHAALSFILAACSLLELPELPESLANWLSEWPAADAESHVASVVTTIHVCCSGGVTESPAASASDQAVQKKLVSSLLRYLGCLCYNGVGLRAVLLSRTSLEPHCSLPHSQAGRVAALKPVVDILSRSSEFLQNHNALLVLDIIADELKQGIATSQAFISVCERTNLVHNVIQCLYFDHPSLKASQKIQLGLSAVSVLLNSVKHTTAQGLPALRTSVIHVDHGLLLALSSLLRAVVPTHPHYMTVLSQVLDLLRLCCGDGGFGDFARQVTTSGEFLTRFFRGVMALSPEQLSQLGDNGLLVHFCKAAATVPKLRDVVHFCGFSSWLFRMGALSQPDLCGPVASPFR